MKLNKILMLAALPLILMGCSVSTKSVSPQRAPQIAMPDSKLIKTCDLPIDLGSGALVQSQVEELWATDRQALIDCYRRHLALRNFIIDRDDALRGAWSVR